MSSGADGLCYDGAMRLIRKTDMKEGRWRNGMGVSWDIATFPEEAGTGGVGWRFATALIERNVPFSAYPGVDRYFTLTEGQGLDLDFEGREGIAVHHLFEPHFYPCDISTICTLRNGPCRALNLFLKRGAWEAQVEIFQGERHIDHDGPILLFALDGPASVDGRMLQAGDAAVTEGAVRISAVATHLYMARLSG